ncbi:MAG: universal stress protein [Gammaproteobacteria bacterium]
MIQKLLLAVDRSAHAEKTIQSALALAKLASAKVVVMHAFSPPASLRRHGTPVLDELAMSLEDEAKEWVAEVAEIFLAEGLNATAVAVEGHPVEAILRAVEMEHPDILVLGSRGEEGGLPGVLLGSVAERVMRHATVSVWVVK